MTEEQFWSSTPRIFSAYDKARKDRVKETNVLMHIFGQYMMSAINATVGNMFQEKGKPKIRYEAQPFDIFDEKTLNIHEGMTEEEKMKETDKLWDSLGEMLKDFNKKRGLPEPEYEDE